MTMHAPHLDALADPPRDQRIALRAPQPGRFLPAITEGALITPGSLLGQLEVLGRSIALHAPRVHGLAVGDAAPRFVDYGDPLFAVDLAAIAGSSAPVEAAPVATGLVFRAPTSGRYYGRATPDKPPFVTAGTELVQGATICLLEVMKTFHRVTYGGERVRIREVLVVDGADVNAGDPLLALES